MLDLFLVFCRYLFVCCPLSIFHFFNKLHIRIFWWYHRMTSFLKATCVFLKASQFPMQLVLKPPRILLTFLEGCYYAHLVAVIKLLCSIKYLFVEATFSSFHFDKSAELPGLCWRALVWVVRAHFAGTD